VIDGIFGVEVEQSTNKPRSASNGRIGDRRITRLAAPSESAASRPYKPLDQLLSLFHNRSPPNFCAENWGHSTLVRTRREVVEREEMTKIL
jgi:hypothetical protein